PGGTVYFNCNPATASISYPSTSGFIVTTGDFNGDGKTDLLLTSTTTNGQLWLGTGTGFVQVSSSLPSGWANGFGVAVGDWNGDGKADIMLVSQVSGTPHQLFLSTGTGFNAALDPSGNPITISNSSTTVNAFSADWNND